ncbi:MAG: hypothetical protein L0H64_09185 [Pseudonocardia sp.]|nr:hypothetical protein [Pseudonocardia sp.]
MPKNVQIRNLDDTTYETLRARAEAEDISLTQYLRRELDHLASVPSMTEWLAEGDRWRARYGGVSREAREQAFDDLRAER